MIKNIAFNLLSVYINSILFVKNQLREFSSFFQKKIYQHTSRIYLRMIVYRNHQLQFFSFFIVSTKKFVKGKMRM